MRACWAFGAELVAGSCVMGIAMGLSGSIPSMAAQELSYHRVCCEA